MPSLCCHRSNAKAAALCVFDTRAGLDMVQRYSIHHRSLYPIMTCARGSFLFTSHVGAPLTVWDKRCRVNLAVHVFVCRSMCLSVCPCVCLSMCLSVHVFVCLSMCLSVCPCVCLPVHVFVCLPACLTCLPVCLSARLCLPACLQHVQSCIKSPQSLKVCMLFHGVVVCLGGLPCSALIM